jgi:dephospho-CoA kinase
MHNPRLMKVIGIIGSKGSGKDTLASYISKKYGAGHHAHSEILSDLLTIIRVPKTRMNKIKLVQLRKAFGENVLINALNKKLVQENRDTQVITGIRFDNELENIRQYDRNLVIYIDAPLEKRFEWQKERKQYAGDEDMSFEEFVRIGEKEETEIHIQRLGQLADHRIENDADLQTLYTKVDEIIKPFLS